MDLPQSDHLILLVGSNPLPNAVAGKLLLKKLLKKSEPTQAKPMITMLHSKGSQSVAERLGSWFAKQPEQLYSWWKEVDESDPGSIAKAVTERLNEVENHSFGSSVGLHYTGGTKTMGVHAYRAVEAWAKKRNSPTETHFSYLNARTLEMIIDPPHAATGATAKKKKVGNAVKIPLEDLMTLHGWEGKWKGKEPIVDPVLPGTAGTLVALHGEKSGPTTWRTWKKNVLEEQCKTDNRWNNNTVLNAVTLNDLGLTNGCVPEKVTAQIREELAGVSSLKDAANKCGYAETREFCDWLDGKWLESAVLAVLRDLTSGLNLHSVKMNVEPVISRTHFEFDVVAVRGYQLFAFSCTTVGSPSQLKHKLFEAVTRARQMGGDEACVALVSCSHDPQKVQEQTRNLFLPGDERIRVFGQKHLAKLQNHIEQWICKCI